MSYSGVSAYIYRYQALEKSALLPGLGEILELDFWSLDVSVLAICETQDGTV